MEKRILGRTGLEVTELCFGALPMGPLQKNSDVEECAKLVELALNMGINFIDTAQVYKTYEPIKLAIERTGIRPIVASKSKERSYAGMEAAVNEALGKLNLDYIDIFHLHGSIDGKDAFELFEDAFNCLKDMKAKGKIKYIGISTHSVAVTNRAAAIDDIDVVFPIINKNGHGIIDGTADEMISAIRKASKAGKGVYLMKVLGGGNLIGEYDEAVKFARSIEGYASIALGMVNLKEIEFNIRYFSGEKIEILPDTDKSLKNVLILKGMCKSCRACAATCPNNAIDFDDAGKAYVNVEKCLTCGYCTGVCPQFAIRVV